jgi:hypothetical protein
MALNFVIELSYMELSCVCVELSCVESICESICAVFFLENKI